MKNTSKSFQAIMKSAKKAGQRDGKNEVPKNDWNKGSIPYLALLHKMFVNRQESNILTFKSKVRQIETSKAEAKQALIDASANQDLAQKRFEEADAQVKKTEQEIRGELEDMPSSLPAKRRNLNSVPYALILFICTIAELSVTIPALQFLLGEKRQFAVLLAFALGTATFFGAHFAGTTLKKRQDRSVPQPRADLILIGIMVSVLLLAIVFLAYVRANQTLPYAGNFVELPEQWRLEVLWIIWAVWQITFFGIATVASFKHHSDEAKRLNQAKRVRFVRKRQLEKANSSLTKMKSNFESLEIDWTPQLNKEVEEIKQNERLLESQYRQACALYVDSNIHSRRQSMKGDHPAFEILEFETKEIDFLGLTPENKVLAWDIKELEVIGEGNK